MTDSQFTALARVSGIKPDTRIYGALRRVYLHGDTQADAARQADISRNSVCVAQRRIENVRTTLPARIALLRAAMGGSHGAV